MLIGRGLSPSNYVLVNVYWMAQMWVQPINLAKIAGIYIQFL